MSTDRIIPLHRSLRSWFVHTIPINDYLDHLPSCDCWCDPHLLAEPDRTIVVHNAADHREITERLTGESIEKWKGWELVQSVEP